MAVFESLLQLMIDAGASYIFMWILFAALIYGVLAKYEVFGEDSVMAGVALGGSFFTLLGVYAFAPAGLFLNFAAAIGFGLFAIFGLAILLSLAGIDIAELAEGDDGNGPIAGLAIGIGFISIIGVILYNVDILGLLSVDTGGNTFQNVVFPILFLIFLLVVMLNATGGD